MNYPDFSIIEFVLNDDFFLWVVNPDPDLDKFWHEWLEQYPHKRKEVEEARRWVLQLNAKFNKVEVKEMPQKELLWQRIMASVKNSCTSNDTFGT
jgi:transmembrane sensor